MTDQFIRGSPESLEGYLANYNPNGKSNITADELRVSVVGYTPPRKPTVFFSDGTTPESNTPNGIYFFFPKTTDSLDLAIANHGQFLIALQSHTYGFSADRKVKIFPKRIVLTLSEKAKDLYERILGLNEISITELLESIGFIVNDSIEYDFERAINDKLKTIQGLFDNENGYQRYLGGYEAILKSKGYTPTGREVIKGVCSDAGKMIRDILYSLDLEKTIGITHVRTGKEVSHDSTVVFDKKTGEWAVINSKSSTKPYNLVPKEKLSEFGEPFVL